MICFADTDILLKLTAFGLLKQALAALGVTSEREVRVTPEAASKSRSSRRIRADFRQEILNEALEFLKCVTVITDPGDSEEREQLRFTEGIDVGETTLFLATKDIPEFILITGDKNTLRALTNHFLSTELHTRHIGRVLCLETILLQIIKKDGFPAVYAKLLAGRQCDKVISNALQNGTVNEAAFIASLERIISRLDFETQGLLRKS